MGYVEKKAYMIAIFLLIVGGLAWGILAFSGKNVVAKAFGKRAWIVYGLVGIAAVLVLLVGRNAFLPFLGPTVFPCAALEDKVPENADVTVQVHAKPGAKVLYWGTEPANEGLKELKAWKDAYAGYQNVGVTTANADGVAMLRLRSPQPYMVPMKGRLESHVHYRMCLTDGWMSQVETQMISSEAFEDMPQPLPPVIPVVANTPELPVIADPISGLPTAVPSDVVNPKKTKETDVGDVADVVGTVADVVGAETPSPIEGFSNEPLYSSSAPSDVASLGTLDNEDPRLQRLRTSVESNAIRIVDDMAYNPCDCGTDLDAAFQAPVRPPTAHVAWATQLQ
jgi:uncharacterized membrane protein YuzA (DUF378 family)